MKKKTLAIDLSPMLATPVKTAFNDPEWVFEVKWDGYRLIIEKQGKKVTLWSRNGVDLSARYPEICKAFTGSKKDGVIDGELVALDAKGMPRFQLMQHIDRSKAHLVFYAFDLLSYDGRDWRKEPLLARKKMLKRILPKNTHIRVSDHITEHGTAFFKQAEQKGLEGIVGKKADSVYQSGRRSAAWVKIKTTKRQEAVVIGYTEPRNSRKYIGSLVLAVREGKNWRYVGHTGGSMGGKPLKEVRELLEPFKTDKKIAEVPREVEKNTTWVEPRQLVEVQFAEWTDSGTMRQPIVVGFRDDKSPEEVIEEKELPSPKFTSYSHINKVYWPKEGYTKGDVIEYYDKIADYILPYLKDRPLVLNRHPNGYDKPSFYQKDTSDLNLPDFVETVMVHSESNNRDIRYIVVNNRETLLYVANLGCIEMNPWNSRVNSLTKPDFFVIDLDPGDNTFDQVIQVAHVVHEVLDVSCEESYVKTSGKTGLHIYVPLKKRYTYDQVRPFAELVARLVHERTGDVTSIDRSPEKRSHKIYLDWLQNRSGQTLAAPYSIRPVEGAAVSTPLEWNELKKGLKPSAFTIKTIHKRLYRKGDLWKPVLGAGVDLQEAIRCLEAEIGNRRLKKVLAH